MARNIPGMASFMQNANPGGVTGGGMNAGFGSSAGSGPAGFGSGGEEMWNSGFAAPPSGGGTPNLGDTWQPNPNGWTPGAMQYTPPAAPAPEPAYQPTAPAGVNPSPDPAKKYWVPGGLAGGWSDQPPNPLRNYTQGIMAADGGPVPDRGVVENWVKGGQGSSNVEGAFRNTVNSRNWDYDPARYPQAGGGGGGFGGGGFFQRSFHPSVDGEPAYYTLDVMGMPIRGSQNPYELGLGMVRGDEAYMADGGLVPGDDEGYTPPDPAAMRRRSESLIGGIDRSKWQPEDLGESASGRATPVGEFRYPSNEDIRNTLFTGRSFVDRSGVPGAAPQQQIDRQRKIGERADRRLQPRPDGFPLPPVEPDPAAPDLGFDASGRAYPTPEDQFFFGAMARNAGNNVSYGLRRIFGPRPGYADGGSVRDNRDYPTITRKEGNEELDRINAELDTGKQWPLDRFITHKDNQKWREQTLEDSDWDIRKSPDSDYLYYKRGYLGYDDGGLISGYADGPVTTNTYGGDDYTVDPLDMVNEALTHGRRSMGLPTNWETGEYDDQPSYQEGGEVEEPMDDGSGVIARRPPPDPRQTLGYLMGQGALAPDVAQSLEQQADPQGTMSPSERTMAAVQAAPTPEARFGYIQSKRQQYNGFSAAARAALDHGQPEQAAAYLNQAHAQVPDNRETQIAPSGDGFVMRQRPLRTGGPSPRRSQVKSFQGGGYAGDTGDTGGEGTFITPDQFEEVTGVNYDQLLHRTMPSGPEARMPGGATPEGGIIEEWKRRTGLGGGPTEPPAAAAPAAAAPAAAAPAVAAPAAAEPAAPAEEVVDPRFGTGDRMSIGPGARMPGGATPDDGVLAEWMRRTGGGAAYRPSEILRRSGLVDDRPDHWLTNAIRGRGPLPPPAEAPKPPEEIKPPELPKPAEPETGTRILRGTTPGVGKPTNFMVYVDKGRGWMYAMGADGQPELVPGQGGPMEGQTLDLVRGLIKRDRSLGRTGRIVSEGEPPSEAEGGPPRRLSSMVPDNEGRPSRTPLALAQRGLTVTSEQPGQPGGTVVRAPVTAADRAAAAAPPAAAPVAAAPAAGAGAPRAPATAAPAAAAPAAAAPAAAAPAAAKQPHPHWEVIGSTGMLNEAGYDYIESKVEALLDRKYGALGTPMGDQNAAERYRAKWGGASPQMPGQDATTRAWSHSRSGSTGATTAPMAGRGVGGGTTSPSSSSSRTDSGSETIPGDRRMGAAMGEAVEPGMMTLALERYTKVMDDLHRTESAKELVTAAREGRVADAAVKAGAADLRRADTDMSALVNKERQLKPDTDISTLIPQLESIARTYKLSPEQTINLIRRSDPLYLPEGRRVGQRSFYQGNWYVLGADGVPALERPK